MAWIPESDDMSKDQQIRQRAIGAVLQKAIFSWQMAVTVIFTLLLFALGPQPFEMWQDWFWLVGGGLAAGAFVAATLTDEQAVQDAVARQFERQFDLSRIKDGTSRAHLRDAMEYRRNMMALATRAKGVLRSSLLRTVDDVNDWIGHMYDLAEHIESFDDSGLVGRDMRTVPQRLERARLRMEREEAPKIRRDLERQVHQLEQQLANLEAAANSTRRAKIQLETTLTALATIYAQMARLGTREVDSGRAQRLRLEIQDEISSLQDTIEAMDEVQSQVAFLGQR